MCRPLGVWREPGRARQAARVSVLTSTTSTIVDSAGVPQRAPYLPRRSEQGRTTESGLTVVPWSRWGLRRLYVNTGDGERVGWMDLDTGNRGLTLPDLGTRFDAALREACGAAAATTYAPRRGLADGPHQEEEFAPVRDAAGEPTSLGADRPGRRACFDQEPGAAEAQRTDSPIGRRAI